MYKLAVDDQMNMQVKRKYQAIQPWNGTNSGSFYKTSQIFSSRYVLQGQKVSLQSGGIKSGITCIAYGRLDHNARAFQNT